MADELTCPRCGAVGAKTTCVDWLTFACGSEGHAECDGAYYVTDQSPECTLGQIIKRAVVVQGAAKDARIAELEKRLATLDKDLRGALWYMHRQYHSLAQREINKLMHKLDGGANDV